MSTRVYRYGPQRRVPLLATATACVLLAVGGPLASADGGDEGSLGADKSNVQTPKTGPVGNIASTVKDTLRDIASSFDRHRSPVNRARVTSGSQRIQTPGPGINFSSDNNRVAANSGPGVNLVHTGDDNEDVGKQSVAPDNFGINTVLAGDGNQNAGKNSVNAGQTGTGSFGGNLLILGNNNGALGESLAGIGTNAVTGNSSQGYNLAILGDNTTLFDGFGSAQNVVIGDRSFGSNVLIGGNDTAGNGGNEVRGNNSSAVNFAFVGDGVANSVDNGAFGNNSSAINFAFIGDNAVNVGNNNLNGSNLFGGNLAIVGAGSQNSANNSNGFMNFAFIGANSLNSGNNTGGGLNIAFVPPNSTGVGNCSSSVCVNLFGVQLMGS